MPENDTATIGVALNIASNAIWVGLTFLATWLFRKFGGHSAILRTNIQLRILAAQSIIAIAAIIALFIGLNAPTIVVAFTVISALSLAWQLDVLRTFGIDDLHRTTVEGVGYTQSLKLAQTKVDFLGIGAQKLTNNGQFAECMKRCATHGRTVRLLLSSPQNPALEAIATRNGATGSQYQSRVTDSLRTIAGLVKAHGYDIQVRFYKSKEERDLPRFRLMFIDHRTCLFSYIVWSNNEGRDNPQMVLSMPKSAQQTSFYRSLEEYFNDIWSAPTTEAIDLKAYE